MRGKTTTYQLMLQSVADPMRGRGLQPLLKPLGEDSAPQAAALAFIFAYISFLYGDSEKAIWFKSTESPRIFLDPPMVAINFLACQTMTKLMLCMSFSSSHLISIATSISFKKVRKVDIL